MKEMKQTWDPQVYLTRVRSPTPPLMDTSLRYREPLIKWEIQTIFDFSLPRDAASR